MFEMMQLLAGTNLILLGCTALIFDVPRYTFSLISLALLGTVRRPSRGAEAMEGGSVTVGRPEPVDRIAASADPAAARDHCRRRRVDRRDAQDRAKRLRTR